MLPKIDSPFETQARAMQLNQMQQAQQENQYQQAQRAQAAADDASYRQALQTSGGDSTRMLSALAGAGNHKGYAQAQAADLAQRKGMADIGKDKAATQKSEWDVLKDANNMIGSAAGALSKKPSYENAVAIVGQLKQRLGPDMATRFGLDTLEIPRDPAKIADWANDHYLAAVDADKQLADATRKTEGVADRAQQDTNSKRTAASSKYAADSSARTAGARLAFDKERSVERATSGGAEPSMDKDTIERLARQVLRGDRTGLANMGRGAQGAANLVAVQNAVTRVARDAGLSPEQITAASAELEGLRTGLRATGNISARVENAAEEAAQLAPLALAASKEVARSGLLPFGKAQIMFNTQTNDPALAKFATANMGLATAYASAMARGNKPTVSDNEHARELLSTAQDQRSYEAKVGQMMQEIEAAKRAPRAVRDALGGEISGKGGHGKAPAAPSLPAGWSVKEN